MQNRVLWKGAFFALAFASMAALEPVAAAPIQVSAMPDSVAQKAEPVSFWGLPFPYGYRYQGRPCFKSVRVHTGTGVRWETGLDL